MQRASLERAKPETRPDRVLPDLRPLRDHGCFAQLTSLSVVNWIDRSCLIPSLLAPFSPLRDQLEHLKFTFLDHSFIDSFALAFILDAIYHLAPLVQCFRGTVPLSARFPAYDKLADPFDDPEWADYRLAGEFDVWDLYAGRCDFEIFASQWDEDGAEDDSELLQIRELVERDVEEQLEFDNLKTLAVSVHTEIHLVLLLGTANVRNLKKLELCGPTIWILPEHVALLRRTISR